MSIRTPYYVFDKNLFNTLFLKYAQSGKVFFPIKANDDPLIVSTILENKGCFEVDSIEHIKQLINIHHVSPDSILYSFPIRETTDIKTALRFGIKLFVIDSLEEYIQISQISSSVKYLIRINAMHFLNKQLPPEQDKWGLSIHNSILLINKIREDNNYLAGISFYIPAEIDQINSFEVVLDSISNCFSNISVDYLNIGGGISLSKLKRIQEKLESTRLTINAKNIIVEPGRHLLNPCIDMVVSVTSIRTVNGSKLVFINSGIYSGLIDAVIKNKKYKIIDNKMTSSDELEKSYICGSSSDISDALGEYNLRQNIKIGDTLIIKECGAYSAVLQTHFYRKDHIKMRLKK